jgi:hypothetical protein
MKLLSMWNQFILFIHNMKQTENYACISTFCSIKAEIMSKYDNLLR